MQNTLSPSDVIWINLKILSMLPPYHRLNAQNELFYIEKVSYFSGIWRYFRGDNRNWTIKRLDDLIQKCEAHLQNHLDQQQKKPKTRKTSNMREHLKKARSGLLNLQETYARDVTTTASIGRLLDKIDALIVEKKKE